MRRNSFRSDQPMRFAGSGEESWRVGCKGGCWTSWLDGQQAVASQYVVGQCEPAQDSLDLFDAADRELIQTPVSEAGIDAFCLACPWRAGRRDRDHVCRKSL